MNIQTHQHAQPTGHQITATVLHADTAFKSTAVFPNLLHESRHSVNTECAAWHLGRKPQTLRGWACHEDGPLLPIRVHGRLAWPTAELRRVLGMVAQ